MPSPQKKTLVAFLVGIIVLAGVGTSLYVAQKDFPHLTAFLQVPKQSLVAGALSGHTSTNYGIKILPFAGTCYINPIFTCNDYAYEFCQYNGPNNCWQLSFIEGGSNNSTPKAGHGADIMKVVQGDPTPNANSPHEYLIVEPQADENNVISSWISDDPDPSTNGIPASVDTDIKNFYKNWGLTNINSYIITPGTQYSSRSVLRNGVNPIPWLNVDSTGQKIYWTSGWTQAYSLHRVTQELAQPTNNPSNPYTIAPPRLPTCASLQGTICKRAVIPAAPPILPSDLFGESDTLGNKVNYEIQQPVPEYQAEPCAGAHNIPQTAICNDDNGVPSSMYQVVSNTDVVPHPPLPLVITAKSIDGKASGISMSGTVFTIDDGSGTLDKADWLANTDNSASAPVKWSMIYGLYDENAKELSQTTGPYLPEDITISADALKAFTPGNHTLIGQVTIFKGSSVYATYVAYYPFTRGDDKQIGTLYAPTPDPFPQISSQTIGESRCSTAHTGDIFYSLAPIPIYNDIIGSNEEVSPTITPISGCVDSLIGTVVSLSVSDPTFPYGFTSTNSSDELFFTGSANNAICDDYEDAAISCTDPSHLQTPEQAGIGDGNPALYIMGGYGFEYAPNSVSYLQATSYLPSSPQTSLSIFPTSVSYSDTATISWQANKNLATSCTGVGFNTGGAISGSVTVGPLTTNQTYTIDCDGPLGKYDYIPQSVGVEVGLPPGTPIPPPDPSEYYIPPFANGTGGSGGSPTSTPPVVAATLTASKTTVPYGFNTTLTWNSSGATSCNGVYGFDTGGATSGSVVLPNPNNATTAYQYTDNEVYTLQCTDGIGDYGYSQPLSVTFLPGYDGQTGNGSGSGAEGGAGGTTGTGGNPGNGGGSGSGTPPPGITAGAPTLTVSTPRITIPANGYPAVSWNATNADSCQSGGLNSIAFSNPSGATSGTTSIPVKLTTPQSFIMSCTGAGGESTESFRWYPASAPPTNPQGVEVGVSIAPTNVVWGTPTTIRWSSVGATSCTGYYGNTQFTGLSNTGFTTAPLHGSTSVLINCTGPDGTVSSNSIPITVGSPPAAGIISFSANPATILRGASTTLSWVTSGMGYCNVSGNGALVTNASLIANGSVTTTGLSSSQTYILNCIPAAGNGGTGTAGGAQVTATAKVTVITPLPSLSVAANPQAITQNSSGSTITWSTSWATSCNLYADIARNGTTTPIGTGLNGTVNVKAATEVNHTIVYTLQCVGVNGSTVQNTAQVTTVPITGTTGGDGGGTSGGNDCCSDTPGTFCNYVEGPGGTCIPY